MPKIVGASKKPSSFKEKPLSTEEIKKLSKILANKKYWQRDRLKKEFCNENNRISSEVNQYIKSNGKSYTGISEVPQAQGEAPKKEAKGRKMEPKTIRTLKIENFRGSIKMEGNQLIIEL